MVHNDDIGSDNENVVENGGQLPLELLKLSSSSNGGSWSTMVSCRDRHILSSMGAYSKACVVSSSTPAAGEFELRGLVSKVRHLCTFDATINVRPCRQGIVGRILHLS